MHTYLQIIYIGLNSVSCLGFRVCKTRLTGMLDSAELDASILAGLNQECIYEPPKAVKER